MAVGLDRRQAAQGFLPFDGCTRRIQHPRGRTGDLWSDAISFDHGDPVFHGLPSGIRE